jgi:hypothetical protein
MGDYLLDSMIGRSDMFASTNHSSA